MSDWSNNNRAHVLTWYSLFILNQLTTGFKESEALKMKDLAFYATAASDELIELQANALGVQLDNMFRMLFNAKFEDGVDAEHAIPALQSGLRNGMRSLPELGTIADDNYRFLGEVSNV